MNMNAHSRCLRTAVGLGLLAAGLVLGGCSAGSGELSFVGPQVEGIREFHVVTVAEGGGVRLLGDIGGLGSTLLWLPDGQRAVVYREVERDYYLADIEAGSLGECLTCAAEGLTGPAVSPDGTQIAFAKSDITATNTYVINADGSGHVQLTDDSVYSAEPAWSPDGRQIAFVRSDQGDTWIFVMKPDGSEPVNLTAQYPDSWAPTWSADGRQIAFVTYSNGSPEIFIMSAGAADAHKLTSLDALGMGPIDLSWGP